MMIGSDADKDDDDPSLPTFLQLTIGYFSRFCVHPLNKLVFTYFGQDN